MRQRLALGVLLLSAASVAKTARAQSGGTMKDDVPDTVIKVLADLDAIAEESRRYPDAPAGDRIRKIVDRARARLQPLAPAPVPAADKPAAGGAAKRPEVAFQGVRQSASKAGSAMPDKEFKDVIRALKNQNLDGARLTVVQNAIDAGGYFSSGQIGQMVHWFTSEDMRIEAAARLWGRCTDSPNFASVYNLMDTQAGKNALKARVEGGSSATPTGASNAPPAGAPKPTLQPIGKPGTTAPK